MDTYILFIVTETVCPKGETSSLTAIVVKTTSSLHHSSSSFKCITGKPNYSNCITIFLQNKYVHVVSLTEVDSNIISSISHSTSTLLPEQTFKKTISMYDIVLMV